MTGLFLFCVLVGGTLLLCQFAMSLLGMGEFGELPEGSADLPGEADLGDLLSGDSSGGDAPHHKTLSIFGILSFQTIVAAMTFFGLAGMAVNRAGGSVQDQLIVAALSGAAAMYGVHWLMRSLHSLGQSGTLSITNAIGREATVSAPIPGNNAGQGKVLLEVQGRLEELAARNSQPERIRTGVRVRVVGVANGNVLDVQAVSVTQTEPTPDSMTTVS